MVLRPLAYAAEEENRPLCERHAVSHHPLRSLRLAGRAGAQCDEGHACRSRAPHAGRKDRILRALGHANRRICSTPPFSISPRCPRSPVHDLHSRYRRARQSDAGGGGGRDPAALPQFGWRRCAHEVGGDRSGHGSRRGGRAPDEGAHARHPAGALFIGEESVAADPALLERLSGADLAVIVDPIDGTFNYASGLPLFGVMASVVAGGETVAGIIYDPMGNDWVIAEKGSGAWFCRADGTQEQMTVTPAPAALDALVGCPRPASIRRRPAARSWGTWPRSASPPAIAARHTNTAPSRAATSTSSCIRS